MQEASLLNSELWHCPEGPLQEARDAAMKLESKEDLLCTALINEVILPHRYGGMDTTLSAKLMTLVQICATCEYHPEVLIDVFFSIYLHVV